jgi:hypothetical protein
MDIPLTQGKVAQIDPEDWPLVASYRWYAYKSTDGKWYAHATALDGSRAKAKVKMHNLILGCKSVDHWDGDGLNNRRLNLRPCTNAQNQQNTGSRGGSSRFKGVSWIAAKKSGWSIFVATASIFSSDISRTKRLRRGLTMRWDRSAEWSRVRS